VLKTNASKGRYALPRTLLICGVIMWLRISCVEACPGLWKRSLGMGMPGLWKRVRCNPYHPSDLTRSFAQSDAGNVWAYFYSAHLDVLSLVTCLFFYSDCHFRFHGFSRHQIAASKGRYALPCSLPLCVMSMWFKISFVDAL
jgi:hypothetical protein